MVIKHFVTCEVTLLTTHRHLCRADEMLLTTTVVTIVITLTMTAVMLHWFRLTY
ncbi:hypothetical protein [Scandinavium sp.]|uniref:hypothetical protein n=1 Tax=Scandinavium sp. TaxID=2830653 RepID=UPI00289EE321|nr:hypothetical protein [Scandinavium sp.]